MPYRFDRVDVNPWERTPQRRAIAAVLLVTMVPAVGDAVASVWAGFRHLGYYADAAMTGTLIVAAGGLLLGAATMAVLRARRGHVGARALAACAYGAASAAVMVLAVPRVLGFDQRAVRLAFYAVPVAAFAVAAIVRYSGARAERVRVVATALVPAIAYVIWLVLARPTLAAPRNERLLTLGLFLLIYGVATLLAFVLERRIRRRPGVPGTWGEAVPYQILGIMLIFWLGVRQPLFPEISQRSDDKRPDVLLVVLDTARSDLHSIGDPDIELPALAALARSSRVYTSAFATSCWTIPTHASMFTGLPPSRTGALTGPLAEGIPTLAQRFRRAGYATAAFSGNPVIGPSSGLDRGFRHFENFLSGEKLRGREHVWLNAVVTSREKWTRPLWHLRDDGGAVMVSRALGYLDRTEGPSLVFLNLFEPHDPYAPPYLPGQWATRNGFTPEELRTMEGRPYAELAAWPPPMGARKYFAAMRLRYKGELWYVDHLLGQLFQRLEAAGRLDDTIVLVVSDHGENLGEHFPSLTHTLGLYDTLTHVPLLVRYPARISPSRDERLLSTDRVHDMLLSLAGIRGIRPDAFDEPETGFVFSEYIPPPGLMDLLENIAGREVPEYERTLRSVRSESMRWVEASDGKHEAFDHRLDPLEQNNLVLEQGAIPEGFAALARRLDSRPVLSNEPARVSEELEKSLRALGYHQ